MNKRPLLISFFSISVILGGILLFVCQIFWGNLLSQAMEFIEIPSDLMVVSFLFLGILSLIAGIGAWKGKKWGWWIGIFYFIYAIARNTNTLFLIFYLPVNSEQFTKYFIKSQIRIIFNCLWVFYFFKSNVMNYFQVNNIRFRKKFFILVLATSAIFLLFFLLANLYQQKLQKAPFLISSIHSS